MKQTMTCKHCGEAITADTEDSLVEQVQAHAATHDGKQLTREHILQRLHRLQDREHTGR